MGFRFQRRVQLFPGVRLNFSASGISTTIGVRGASVTLGKRGAYANLGLPGTGLSYRQRIDTPASRNPSAEPSSPELGPPFPNPSPAQTTEGAIRSSPTEELTSPGLGELKRLINEATIRRSDLQREVTDREIELRHAVARFRRATFFVVRLFTKSRAPKLLEDIHAAERALAESRAQLEGCHIDVDFAFDDATQSAYAALLRSFENLRASEKIWDITASVATNRVAQRTTATQSIERRPARLAATRSEIIQTQYQALFFSNANGDDILIFPGFVMLRSPSTDFALIDVRELRVSFSPSRFIEEDTVPSDAVTVGHTWKKANKDGSPDRRFSNNYQIPVVRYAELEFRSATGLWEVYQFSSYERAESFYSALTAYQKCLQKLSTTDGAPLPLSAFREAAQSDTSGSEDAEDGELSQYKAPRSLLPDWIALALLVLGGATGTMYVASHTEELRQLAETITTAQPPAAQPTKASAAATAPTAQTFDYVYVQKPGVNIRSGASASSAVIRQASRGDRLRVFGKLDQWYQVGDRIPIGWIHESLVGNAPPRTPAKQ